MFRPPFPGRCPGLPYFAPSGLTAGVSSSLSRRRRSTTATTRRAASSISASSSSGLRLKRIAERSTSSGTPIACSTGEGSSEPLEHAEPVEQQTPATREGTREAGQRTPPRPVFLPPADIYETKDSIVVLAEMPGVSPEGVDISLERRVLTIRGRSVANEHGGYRRVYNEYTDGDYERVFTLSENIDRDRIEATLKDGILQLVLPKAEAAKARKIELKAS